MPAPSQSRPATPIFSPTLLHQITRPTHIYGRRRNYVYYPERWNDPVTGRVYEQGYYDDSGVRYEDVSFEKDGYYENVVCRCPYCDTKTLMTLNAEDATTQVLDCPNCGGQMNILSELDDFISAKEESTASHEDSYGYSSRSYTTQDRSSYDSEVKTSNSARKTAGFVLLVLIVSTIITAGKYAVNNAKEIVPPNSVQEVQIVEAPSSGIQIIPGKPVYLESQSNGYHVVSDVLRSDKILYWDSDYESWHDESTESWLWYNTDVNPNTWQYWVEGISSDFGEYGWMEHDSEGWWIEESEGNWIQLPAVYNTENLWFIS